MAPKSMRFTAELDHFEGDTEKKEGSIALYAPDGDSGRAMVGSMRYAESLLPTAGRSGGEQFEVNLSFEAGAADGETDVTEQRSAAELRADYMGMKTIERTGDEKAMFVFRAVDADTEGREGTVSVFPDDLPAPDALSFLDRSREFQQFVWDADEQPEHVWPTGEPYESYPVAVTFERSSDDP